MILFFWICFISENRNIYRKISFVFQTYVFIGYAHEVAIEAHVLVREVDAPLVPHLADDVVDAIPDVFGSTLLFWLRAKITLESAPEVIE
jgi:uncharacterized membrane protein YobD (UPF0266 family)